MNLLRYTNGMGHLIMSILSTITGLCLVLAPTDATTKGIGVTLIMTVQGYWFVSGSAKQVASEVTSLIQQPSSDTVTMSVSAVPKVTTIPKETHDATT